WSVTRIPSTRSPQRGAEGRGPCRGVVEVIPGFGHRHRERADGCDGAEVARLFVLAPARGTAPLRRHYAVGSRLPLEAPAELGTYKRITGLGGRGMLAAVDARLLFEHSAISVRRRRRRASPDDDPRDAPSWCVWHDDSWFAFARPRTRSRSRRGGPLLPV